MRHSSINLTMGTYTDARLLDTAQAVEALPSLPIPDDTDLEVANDRSDQKETETVEHLDAPMEAPSAVQDCPNGASGFHLDQAVEESGPDYIVDKNEENTLFPVVLLDGRYRIRICDFYGVNPDQRPWQFISFAKKTPLSLS